jgi:hypothetical protein
MSFEASLGLPTEDDLSPIKPGTALPVGGKVESDSMHSDAPHRRRSRRPLEPAVGGYFSGASIGTK